jgi:hypothetical protein
VKHLAWILAVLCVISCRACLEVTMTLSDGEAKMIENYRKEEEQARIEAERQAEKLRITDNQIIVEQ